MKNKRKRTLCLLLISALLICSSPIPVSAAEEESLEMVIDEVEISVEEELSHEIEPPIPEYEPGIYEVRSSNAVRNQSTEEETEPPEIYPLQVAGVQVTSANAADVLGDGAVSYVDGILHLYNAQIDSDCCIEAKESLTIVLQGNNHLHASGSYPAIYAENGLTLRAGDQETPSLYADAETAAAIQFGTGVTVEGGVHLKISQTGSGDVYAFPEGFTKIAEEPFTEAAAVWTADGSALEFISKDHLGGWSTTTDTHYLTCADQICLLGTNLQLLPGIHEETTPANCLAPAQCQVCGSFGDIEPNHHISEETRYRITENTHLLVHNCCDQAVETALEKSHEWETVLSEDQTALLTLCKVCKTEACRVTVQKPAGDDSGRIIWDNQPKPAIVENSDNYEIRYYPDTPTDAGTGTATAPTEPGTYVAVVTFADQPLNPCVRFTIEKRSLADMTMEAIADKQYNGSQLKPSAITVRDGDTILSMDHYHISYARQEEGTETFTPSKNLTDAGTIQVTATAKPEDPHYTGSVSTSYQITKAMVPEMVFEPDLPEEGQPLVYDGKKKSLSCKQKNEYTLYGFGAGRVEFYQSAQGEVLQTDAQNAGIYQVKIRVAESKNYQETLLENEAWTLTILPSETYQDHTKPIQFVGQGVGQFSEPTFTGVQKEGTEGPEPITGTVHYTYGNGQSADSAAAVQAYLDSLPDGTTVPIQYTFEPDSDNYTPITEARTIQVKKVALSFQMEDGAQIQPETLKKLGTITYGDTEIVDISKLTATANCVTDDQDDHFTVRYAMLGSDGYDKAHLLDKPNAGSAQFIVFYSNPDLGGVHYQNIEVTSGYITVARKAPAISTANKPQAEPIILRGSPLPLLSEDNKGKTDDGLPLEYSLNKEGPYTQEIPLVSEAGFYTLWYRPAQQENYVYPTPADSVQIIAAPSLTATYGETLAQIRDQLPEGFTYNYANPSTNEVGNAGDHTVLLDFTHPKDNVELPNDYPTLTGFAVPLTVEPRLIRAELRVNGTHYRYTYSANNEPVEKKPTVQVFYETEDGMRILPENAYQVSYRSNRYPGYGVAGIISGNYRFSEDSVTEASFVIYRPGIYGLSIVPDTLKERYDSVEVLKEALRTGLTEKAPDHAAYYNIKMQEYDEATQTWNPSSEEFYCPENGFTFTIPYPQGTNENTHTFELVGMDTMLRSDNRSVKPMDFVLLSQGIQFRMDGYAAVCLAWKEIPDDREDAGKTYTIKRNSSTRGNITFTIGDDPTLLTKAKASAGEPITVHIRDIKTNYEIVRVEYYETGSGYDTATAPDITRNHNGSYTFEMPGYSTSIKVTFRKSSGNPRTGDDFPLHFWITLMGISAAGAILLTHRKQKHP